jgi:hypothetical protein
MVLALHQGELPEFNHEADVELLRRRDLERSAMLDRRPLKPNTGSILQRDSTEGGRIAFLYYSRACGGCVASAGRPPGRQQAEFTVSATLLARHPAANERQT